MNKYSKKAIVIGASSGIGSKLAQLLVNDGYQIGITGRRFDLLKEQSNQNPESYFIKSFDVSKTKEVTKNLEELTKELGGLDLLVLSAGTGDINEDLDLSIEQTTNRTNVDGFTAVVNWAYKYFKHQNSGHIVVITSIAGLRGSRVSPAYNASKAYQINYLEGLRQKIKKQKLNLNITDIRPGLVDTAMAKGEGKFWVASVDSATNQILAAIKQKAEVRYVTKRWSLIAFIIKILPNFIYNKL